MRVDAVILNPQANAGAGERRYHEARQTSLGQELGLDRAEVFSASGLQGWLRERLRGGARRFVIVGGDGTVHGALNSYLNLRENESDLPGDAVFGAIGVGSSNDFQKPFAGAHRARIGRWPCRLDFKAAFRHDVGVLRLTPGNERRFFFVNASLGVTAEANDRFNRGTGGILALKRMWVDGAIVSAALSTFASWSNRGVRLKVDGGAERELALTNLGLVKNRHFSGSFRYEDGAAPDDGMLGLRLCSDMSRIEMLATLNAMSKGRFSGRPKTECAQAREVEVHSLGGPLAVETDGEVTRASSAHFSVRQKEVLLCP